MCNQCEENEQKLLVDRPTDSSKPICPPFFEGEHKKSINMKFKKYVRLIYEI
jgi:hypothetical protein